MFPALSRRAAAVTLLLVPALALAQPGGRQPGNPPAGNRQPAAGRQPAQNPGSQTPFAGQRPAAAGQAAELKTFEEKLSYVLGVNTARRMRNDNVNPDPRIFSRGFIDEFGEGKSLLSDEEMTQVLNEFQQRLQAQAEEAQKELSTDWNKTFEGMPQGEAQTTESGLKYEIFEQGDGPKPKPTDVVVVHYVGKFPDGKVFDSSIERGEPLPLSLAGEIIQGWKEALPLMPVGSRYRFSIPANLAYGEEGRPPVIEGNQDLVFDIELIDIASQQGQGSPGAAPPGPEGDPAEGAPAPPE